MSNFKRILWQLSVVAVLLATMAGAARADNLPIAVEPDGTQPDGASPTAEPVTNDDPPIPPDAADEEFYVYVSAPGNGSVGGINYADEDVMMHDTATGQWMKVFDGTNHGLPASADIDALDYSNVNLQAAFYLSFDKPTAVPGLGTVDDSDVVLRSCFLGTCAWSLFFDGSTHGLTTGGEDVDAIDVVGSNIALSTSGGYNVPKYGGGTLQGGDEDIILYAAVYGNYLPRLDGSAKGLAAGNDTRAIDFDRHFGPDRDWMFLVFEDPFTYQYTSDRAVSGAANDIFVDEMPSGGSGGGPAAGTIWDASAAGFPNVDAIELIEK